MLMSTNRVAFFPYRTYGIDYIVTMQRLIGTQYEVVDYKHLKYGLWDISEIGCIYLNWLEDYMDEDDKTFLRRASESGIKIIWVFHNKVTHDSNECDKSLSNIVFLSRICDSIVLHSKNSGRILASICGMSYEGLKEKFIYIPHPNYIGDYRAYNYPGKKRLYEEANDSRFTFLFVGQMRPYKNIEVLIRAFQSVRNLTDSRLIMAGRFINKNYYRKILQFCDGSHDIILHPFYVGALEMKTILDKSDVLVLPYSLESSMNSGTMLMAFSYKKTVIIPDICMADDYSDELIYKYQYRDENEHVEGLKKAMIESYRAGKDEMRHRGVELYKTVERDNSKETVRNMLIDLCHTGIQQ